MFVDGVSYLTLSLLNSKRNSATSQPGKMQFLRARWALTRNASMERRYELLFDFLSAYSVSCVRSSWFSVCSVVIFPSSSLRGYLYSGMWTNGSFDSKSPKRGEMRV